MSGGKVFDCVLAVTAKENGVEKIYTENVEDFDFLQNQLRCNYFKLSKLS